MIALGSVDPRAKSRPACGVLLALLELAAELGDHPAAAGAWVPARDESPGVPTLDDPGRSSAWLQSLHREWTESESDSESEAEAPRCPATRTGGQVGRYRLIERL